MKTKIIRLEEIDSTNRYLKNYREEGDEEMIVAVADYQAAGKGQGTHTWESEKGKPAFQYQGVSSLDSCASPVCLVYGWCSCCQGCIGFLCGEHHIEMA